MLYILRSDALFANNKPYTILAEPGSIDAYLLSHQTDLPDWYRSAAVDTRYTIFLYYLRVFASIVGILLVLK